MGNAEAHSRRGNLSDDYITPFPCIRALLDRVDVGNKKILDPCCGTGAIGKVLSSYGHSLNEYDIKSGKDFYDEKKEYDLIISNPPYSQKTNFIIKAQRIAKEIYFILPMNVCNYNFFHEHFLDKCNFLGKYLMTPKFFMTDKETENPKRGGISAYAWFHWSGLKGTVRDGAESYERYINLNNYFRGNK